MVAAEVQTPMRRRSRRIARPATISVQRTNYDHGQPVSESVEDGELVDVPVFLTEPGFVEVEGSITRNMGNYNSVRIQVTLRMPVLPVMSEVGRVYTMASQWVEARLGEEMVRANDTRTPTESELRR